MRDALRCWTPVVAIPDLRRPRRRRWRIVRASKRRNRWPVTTASRGPQGGSRGLAPEEERSSRCRAGSEGRPPLASGRRWGTSKPCHSGGHHHGERVTRGRRALCCGRLELPWDGAWSYGDAVSLLDAFGDVVGEPSSTDGAFDFELPGVTTVVAGGTYQQAAVLSGEAARRAFKLAGRLDFLLGHGDDSE